MRLSKVRRAARAPPPRRARRLSSAGERAGPAPRARRSPNALIGPQNCQCAQNSGPARPPRRDGRGAQLSRCPARARGSTATPAVACLLWRPALSGGACPSAAVRRTATSQDSDCVPVVGAEATGANGRRWWERNNAPPKGSKAVDGGKALGGALPCTFLRQVQGPRRRALSAAAQPSAPLPPPPPIPLPLQLRLAGPPRPSLGGSAWVGSVPGPQAARRAPPPPPPRTPPVAPSTQLHVPCLARARRTMAAAGASPTRNVPVGR
jgi:hypothetical protein